MWGFWWKLIDSILLTETGFWRTSILLYWFSPVFFSFPVLVSLLPSMPTNFGAGKRLTIHVHLFLGVMGFLLVDKKLLLVMKWKISPGQLLGLSVQVPCSSSSWCLVVSCKIGTGSVFQSDKIYTPKTKKKWKQFNSFRQVKVKIHRLRMLFCVFLSSQHTHNIPWKNSEDGKTHALCQEMVQTGGGGGGGHWHFINNIQHKIKFQNFPF